MLIAKGVQKSYGDLKVLKGVDVDVKKGEVVAFVGSSGAGKSTLLHILGTLDTPDTGSVLIGGKDVFRESAKNLALFRNRNIGFVFQFHNLLPEFTALENVMIPGLIAKRKDSEVKDKALDILSLLGLDKRTDQNAWR